MRLIKCYGAECLRKEVKHLRETLIKSGGKNYCPKCLEKKNQDMIKRQSLYDTIKKYFNVNFPTGMMLKQISRFEEEAGYTLDGMEKTLHYMKNCCDGIRFNYRMGLGIITFKYEEAQEYYRKQEELTSSVNPFDSPEEVAKVESGIDASRNDYRIRRIIDLDDIGV